MTRRARRSTWASSGPAAGQAAGHGDLGAVEDHVVGQVQRRTDQAERQRRVEHDQLGAELGRHGLHAVDHERVGQQHRLPDPLDQEGLRRSHCSAPLWGLVSTAKLSGGRRRHSSQR